MYDKITCKDGLEMSVQASSYHYCTPCNDEGPYTHVEVGFPTEEVDTLMPYAEGGSTPTDTVYGFVPIQVVLDLLCERGGVVSGELPPNAFGLPTPTEEHAKALVDFYFEPTWDSRVPNPKCHKSTGE